MKKFILEFLRRGVVACGFGPMVLAIFYFVSQQITAIDTLTVNQVCIGIFSITALAFVAGGMNAVYQIEQLPLMFAILIHGIVLYGSYLATYLINGWLVWGHAPIIIFTVAFVIGYLAIWAVIYAVIRRKTAQLNKMLEKKQQNEGDSEM